MILVLLCVSYTHANAFSVTAHSLNYRTKTSNSITTATYSAQHSLTRLKSLNDPPTTHSNSISKSKSKNTYNKSKLNYVLKERQMFFPNDFIGAKQSVNPAKCPGLNNGYWKSIFYNQKMYKYDSKTCTRNCYTAIEFYFLYRDSENPAACRPTAYFVEHFYAAETAAFIQPLDAFRRDIALNNYKTFCKLNCNADLLDSDQSNRYFDIKSNSYWAKSLTMTEFLPALQNVTIDHVSTKPSVEAAKILACYFNAFIKREVSIYKNYNMVYMYFYYAYSSLYYLNTYVLLQLLLVYILSPRRFNSFNRWISCYAVTLATVYIGLTWWFVYKTVLNRVDVKYYFTREKFNLGQSLVNTGDLLFILVGYLNAHLVLPAFFLYMWCTRWRSLQLDDIHILNYGVTNQINSQFVEQIEAVKTDRTPRNLNDISFGRYITKMNTRLEVYNKNELMNTFCTRFFNLDGDINNLQSNAKDVNHDLLGNLIVYFNSEYTNSGQAVDPFLVYMLEALFQYPSRANRLNAHSFNPGVDQWYKPQTGNLSNLFLYVIARLVLTERLTDVDHTVQSYLPEYTYDLSENRALMTKLLGRCMDSIYEDKAIELEDIYRLNLANLNSYTFADLLDLVNGLYELSEFSMHHWHTEVLEFRTTLKEPDFYIVASSLITKYHSDWLDSSSQDYAKRKQQLETYINQNSALFGIMYKFDYLKVDSSKSDKNTNNPNDYRFKTSQTKMKTNLKVQNVPLPNILEKEYSNNLNKIHDLVNKTQQLKEAKNKLLLKLNIKTAQELDEETQKEQQHVTADTSVLDQYVDGNGDSSNPAAEDSAAFSLSASEYTFLVNLMFNLRQYIVNKEYKTIKKVTDLYADKDRDILHKSWARFREIGRKMQQVDVKFIMKFVIHVREMIFFAQDYVLETFYNERLELYARRIAYFDLVEKKWETRFYVCVGFVVTQLALSYVLRIEDPLGDYFLDYVQKYGLLKSWFWKKPSCEKCRLGLNRDVFKRYFSADTAFHVDVGSLKREDICVLLSDPLAMDKIKTEDNIIDPNLINKVPTKDLNEHLLEKVKSEK